ncbi:MAG: FAD-binding oxidoreductase [Flavobacteriales bacterium]|nr:FAD-binding oxidoreductase [Flavobacteriales bacterium]
MQLSYWEKKRFFDGIDVAIIGSGIVGLSAAIELKRTAPNKKIVVLERGFLPYGASTRNAGFACFGSITELEEDLLSVGEQETFALVERRYKGLVNLRQLLGDHSIGLERKGGYEVFSSEEEWEKARTRIPYFNQLLANGIGEKVYSEFTSLESQFGFSGFKGAILNQFEAQIDTGEMMANLLRLAQKEGIIILNGIQVEDLDGQRIITRDFDFKVGQVLITTNGFARQLIPELNVDPARAQVLVTEEIPGLKLEGTFHYQKGYYYFRNIGKRILLGGGRNLDFEGEKSTEMIQTSRIQEALEELLYQHIIPYEKPNIEMRWSGVMGVGEKRSPIVKQLNAHQFCAVRMGGMGVAIGTLVGKDIATLMLSAN